MKKITLLLVMLLAVVGVNAKTKTTTLWEETYTGGNIEIPVANLVSGATITVSTTVKASDTSDDRKLRIFYTAGNGWSQTSFEDVSDWVELTAGQESYSFTLTSSAYNILYDNTKSHQILYIGANNANCVTISKITMTAEVTAGETELFNSEWPSSWEAKTFAAQSAAKIGDVIQVQYKAFKDDSTDWPWVQFDFMDASGNNFVDHVAASKQKNSVTTFEFEIKTADVLEKIQTGGFSIKGDQFILTSVKLLTYDDSYDAVSITVGSDGIATYSNGGKNVQISACDALKAYYASAVAEGTVTLTELTGCIPASTGVMIYGAEGTYTVPVGSEGWPSITTNYLKATGDYSAEVAASTTEKYHYIFAKNGTGDIGFYKLISNHTLAVHKAYLETDTDLTPSDQNARVALIFDDGETTGVNEVRGLKSETRSEYYDLMGRKVAHPTRGLYIVNGKKVLIK